MKVYVVFCRDGYEKILLGIFTDIGDAHDMVNASELAYIEEHEVIE